jgi:hypothetical protein
LPSSLHQLFASTLSAFQLQYGSSSVVRVISPEECLLPLFFARSLCFASDHLHSGSFPASLLHAISALPSEGAELRCVSTRRLFPTLRWLDFRPFPETTKGKNQNMSRSSPMNPRYMGLVEKY